MTTPIRALIVEDFEDDASLLVLELKRAGYDVVYERVDTRAAMKKALETNTWDIVFSDYSMPQFRALDALEILKASGHDLPFILISGTIGEEVAVEALRAGANDFLVKGRLARLAPALQRELREARLRKERRDALEKLLLVEQARDEFLSIASHELKTPITTLELQLASALRLMKSGAPDALSPEKLESKLVVALRQVDRLTALVNHLLDVTKIKAGHLTFALETLDLRALAESVVQRAHDAIKRSHSDVLVEGDAEVVGHWDSTTLATALRNLLNNALTFGEGKPIVIRVGHTQSTATLSVRDQGIGIAPEEQGRIFQRFERAVSPHHYGGLGLGLWVTKQIVEAHAGTIYVASEEGSGSTFTIELPLGTSDLP